MNESDKDLMNRYIYEVIRRVPGAQKEEITMELKELIEDMYDNGEGDMEAVLTKLGDPKKFAAKYRDESRYIISPEYYDNYMWVLKVVLLSVLFSIVVSAFVQLITRESGFSNIMLALFGNILSAGVGAFGAVTLVFAFLERQKVKVEFHEEKEWTVNSLTENSNEEKKNWTPGLLQPVPDKRALISRGEALAELVFTMIFIGLLLFAPYLFGAYVFDEGKLVRTIPIFNLDQWSRILPFMVISIMIGFVDEIVKLLAGCYCTLVMICNLICGFLQIIFVIVMFKVLDIWNPKFIQDITSTFDIRFSSKGDLFYYYGTGFFSNVLLAIICGAIVLEMGTTIYKTLRYGRIKMN